jgi:hypothetical protein
VADLETVDIPAVEILASGGPVYAIGSPPEGDFYTRDELEAIALAHRELGNEIRAPIKLGHSDRQQLLANSGLTKGEMPAAGWLDSGSFRVEDDAETGVAKLLADARSVPKKIADLMNVGAYRTRSSEIRQYASQATQKTYAWVVEGLALLGEQIPAVQTLDDVYRLYERAGIDRPDADTYIIRRQNAAPALPDGVTTCSMKGTPGYSGGGACHVHDGSDSGKADALAKAKADVAKARKNAALWDTEDSLEDLRGDLQEALNPFGYDMPGVTRMWVRDVARSSNVALVCAGYDDDEAYVVPFTVDANGEPVPGDRSTWTAAEMTWVAAANELARKNWRAAESRAMELTLTDEQVATVREQLGLDADAELTPEAIAEATEARANELKERDEKIAELEQAASERKNESTTAETRINELESRVEASEKRAFEMERDSDLESAVRAGKIDPADLDDWRKDYEESQAGTRRVLERLKPDPDLVRELGRDDAEDAGENDEQYQRDFERRHGMKAKV